MIRPASGGKRLQHDQVLPKLYLAGKIRTNCWRHDLVKDLRGAWISDYYIEPSIDPPPWPVLRGAVLNGRADYVGPYFVSCDHGCAHGRGDHAINEACGPSSDHIGLRVSTSAWTYQECRDAVSRADTVFAYIDEPDCFGTLIELGWASALGKPIWLCFPRKSPFHYDMWFAMEAAAAVEYGDPAEALGRLLPSKHPLIESPAEQSFWDAHLAASEPSLVDLEPQYWVDNYRLDFAIPGRKFGVEIDGFAYHNDKETFEKDRKRHRELERLGWRIVRFSGKEALDQPDQCVKEAAHAAHVFRGLL